MTIVWNIDCDKWHTVLLISLWAGATIGLGVGLNAVVQHIITGGYHTCYYLYGSDQCDFYYPIIIPYVLAFGANLFNTIAIWKAVNGHFKLIEVHCVSKNDDDTDSKKEQDW